MIWNIALAIVLAVCILSFVQLMVEALVNSKRFERFVGGLGLFLTGYERGARGEVTQPPVVYGSGAQEPRELFPALSNRQTFLRVCLVLGVGFVICTGIVGVPVVKNAVQTERLERQRIAFVTEENNIVGNMDGHTYFFAADGDTFLIQSTEPIYPDTPERLLRENVLNVPWKVEQLRSHGFHSVQLGYAVAKL